MTILGVVLAAGTGSRFDAGNKLLADLGGRPVLVRTVDALLDSSVDRVVAVTGHRADDVEQLLREWGVDSVRNPDYEAGQSSSVRRGVEVARAQGADAALFALGDMPCVRPATVDAICETYRTDDPGIVVPRRDGERGNPVLFDGRHFDALAGTSGDIGGRGLFSEHPVTYVDCDDPGIHLDVDTEADLDRLRQRCTDFRG